MKTARGAISRFMDILFTFSGVLLGCSSLMTLVNALSRKAFSIGFSWSEELCTYCVVIGVFLTLPFLEIHDEQLSIGIINSIIKNKKVLKVMYIVRGLVIVALCFIIGWYGINAVQAAIKAQTQTYILRWPKSILYSIAVSGFWLVIVSWLTIFILNKGDKLK